jgi:ferredoxin
MKVRVDETRCQGHTLCAATAPDVFNLREDDGHSYVEDENVREGLEDAVRRAALGCPEQAILVVEDG